MVVSDNMLRDSKNKHRGEVSYSLADQMERSRGAGEEVFRGMAWHGMSAMWR